ncbi:hypothetical protein GYMLUDRAFT_125633, partial [Collybiopsis luxurians FD-317 M1]
LHHFPLDPTSDTLSFYIVFMSSHIEPRSVVSYLSGICNQLEPFFPNVRDIRKSDLVMRSLKGCKRLKSKPVNRKNPLTRDHLNCIASSLGSSPLFDDLLWATLVFTGFHGLLRLGEMVINNNKLKRNPRKYCRRLSAKLSPSSYEFILKSHKADKFFEGNRVLIDNPHALLLFRRYLTLRDTYLPLNPYLWVRRDGSLPTRSWFLSKLHSLFPDRSLAGQSMRAGGATALAEDGAPFHIIQAKGRWVSETFHV